MPESTNFLRIQRGHYFPNVGKGGFIAGGASGNAVVYEKGRVVGMADLKEIDVGFQIGGQAVTEAIFFERKMP